MIKMKKYIYFILFLSFLSCDDWLTIVPKAEITEEQLFEEEAGYRSALYGLYVQLGQTSLYGRNLTMGFTDVLAQYYAIPSESYAYYKTSIYDYEDQETKRYIGEIWSSAYNVVANINNLLQHLEGHETGFFTEPRAYNIMRGESLGLRAMLHFDLLRLFAPAAPNAKAIPYVDVLVKTPFPQLTVQQTIDRCLKDLQEASDLLYEVDPISPFFPTWTEISPVNAGQDSYINDGGFIYLRRERMNYLAVRALMARINLYAGNRAEAQRLAGECVNSGRANLSTSYTAVANNVFSIFVEKLPQISDSLFSTVVPINQCLVVPVERKQAYYETSIYGSVDSRIANYFQYYPGTSSEFLAKFRITRQTIPPSYATVPLITSAEVRLIYSETADTEADKFAHLNTVRNSYGLSASYNLSADKNDYEQELFKEYRKRFVGEGQLFYFMKRKNYQSIPYAGTSVSIDRIFSLLEYLPTAEYEYGLINK
ncbi:hypothetical protein FACS1894177_02100 [Bacteroidia bacterium]|nr:hypothetical protein FACS1894177_02100 [Bacteroidia bacterium]